MNRLGWTSHPEPAIKYKRPKEVRRIAQEIADNQGYDLLICELFETDQKYWVEEVLKIAPKYKAN